MHECTFQRLKKQGMRDSALLVQSADVSSDVIIGNGFNADGLVSFRGSKVAGGFSISQSTVNGIIEADGIKVDGTFCWQQMKGCVPKFSLDSATFGKLDDDRQSWNIVDELYLNGLTYDDLGPSMSQQDRLDWLGKNLTIPEKGDKGQDLPSFNPQPYSHLAALWDRHGRRSSAARVLYEREKRVRANEFERGRRTWSAGIWPALRGIFQLLAFVLVHQGFRVLFGYGYLPMRALGWSAGLIVLAALFFGTIYDRGKMAPAAGVIMASEEWRKAVADGCPVTQAPEYRAAIKAGCEMPLALWEGRQTGVPAQAAADYESFNAVLYGADVFIPLVGLGQETAWSPSRDRGVWGFWGFYTRWIFQALGWIITALGAATLTGLVGRRD